MGQRDDTKRSIEHSRERMSEYADELSRRLSPQAVKDRTKEMAVRRATEWKDRAVSSPVALGAIGGSVGAALGMWLGRRGRERAGYEYSGGTYSSTGTFSTGEQYYPQQGGAVRHSWPRSEYEEIHLPESQASGVGFEGRPEESTSGKIASKASEVKEKVSEKLSGASEDVRSKASSAVERAKETAWRTREKVPSASEARSWWSSWYTSKVNDAPLFTALGTIALGAAAALLVPVSSRERRAMAPVKERAREQIETMGEQLERRVEGDTGEIETERPIVSGPSQPEPVGPVIH